MIGRLCRYCGNGVRSSWRPAEAGDDFDDWYEHWSHLLPEVDEICDQPVPIPLPEVTIG